MFFVFSVLQIGFQALDILRGKLFQQTQLLQAVQRTMKPMVLGDGTGLIEIDIRMGLELLKGEAVDVQLPEIPTA